MQEAEIKPDSFETFKKLIEKSGGAIKQHFAEIKPQHVNTPLSILIAHSAEQNPEAIFDFCTAIGLEPEIVKRPYPSVLVHLAKETDYLKSFFQGLNDFFPKTAELSEETKSSLPLIINPETLGAMYNSMNEEDKKVFIETFCLEVIEYIKLELHDQITEKLKPSLREEVRKEVEDEITPGIKKNSRESVVNLIIETFKKNKLKIYSPILPDEIREDGIIQLKIIPVESIL